MLNVVILPVDEGCDQDVKPLSKWHKYFYYPTFTIVVSIVNVALLIWTLTISGIAPMNVNPMVGPSAETLIYVGGKWTPYILDRAEWWRLISATYLHAGILHLISNLLTQFAFGWVLEQKYGTIRFSVIYILSGIGSIITSAIFLPQYVSVGASGAIFGIIAIWAVDIIQNVKTLRHPVATVLCVVLFIVISLVLGLLPFIDNFGHIGGLLFGLELCMIFILKFDWDQLWKRRLRWVIFYLFIVIFLVNFIGFIVLLYTVDVYTLCPGCKYINCIPVIVNGVDWCK
jgi:membrane associated rhomboid family serine protease